MLRRKPAQAGFSAVELAIVAAVILVIAAIAVPRLLHARVKANEVAAGASLKAIQSAQTLYQGTYPDRGYAPSLVYLGNNGSTCESTSPTNACLIDSTLASGLKSGYLFDLLGDGKTPDLSYTVTATPASSSAGDCSFSMNQSGAIQLLDSSPAAGRAASNTLAGSSGAGSGCGL